MKSKAEAIGTLNDFAHNVGIPDPIVMDNAREETDAQWEETRKTFLMQQRVTEPYSPCRIKLSQISVNLRNTTRELCTSQEHQKYYGIIVWNMWLL